VPLNAWLIVRGPLDRVAAALLGVLLTPVCVVIGVAARLAQGAPVLVRLPRVGRDGELFAMLKFRTMRPDSADGLAEGSRITHGRDSRVTPLGRFLRHHRLDELPQLFNVLTGSMAMIGPRPETPEFVDTTDPSWREVLGVLPGIAGVTQLLIADLEPILLGATNPTLYAKDLLPLKLDLDRFYARNAGPCLDMAITVGLANRVLRGRPATGVRRIVQDRAPDVHGRLQVLVAVATALDRQTG
jgi:lipopolysaccharide/colanic/teichoic acid biosynthesis glycosyltransferase